jgi:hypothetical protein
MDKIVEALKKLLPDTDVSEVAGAVKEMLEQTKVELESEYNEKLEEAYAELSTELAQAEKIAEEGYGEAYSIIGDLRNRLELQGEEYKAALEEGYEEAYQMLRAAKEDANKLEIEMYEEYDKKYSAAREYIIDQLDSFLQSEGAEIYEQAKRDILNDPRMAEHKVVLDRIVDLTANYLSDEGITAVSSSKLEESLRAQEELKGQIRIMEARNIRLSNENTKLNEAVRNADGLLKEHAKTSKTNKKTEVLNEQKERIEKGKNVTGRGHISADDGVVLSEHTNSSVADLDNYDALVLSGIRKPK